METTWELGLLVWVRILMHRCASSWLECLQTVQPRLVGQKYLFFSVYGGKFIARTDLCISQRDAVLTQLTNIQANCRKGELLSTEEALALPTRLSRVRISVMSSKSKTVRSKPNSCRQQTCRWSRCCWSRCCWSRCHLT